VTRGSVKSTQKQTQQKAAASIPANIPRKLSYKDQKELDALPGKIEKLELEQENLQKEISDVDFYKRDKDSISGTLQHLESIQKKLESGYQRWEELE
jgi:ATP-binding cassette subfamily F protein uup